MEAPTRSYRFARERVDEFASEIDDVIAQHQLAMECCDCEAYLKLGVDAYGWLEKADQDIHAGWLNGTLEYNPDVARALFLLHEAWLKPCEIALQWAAIQEKRGFDVSYLKEFRNCMEEVEAIVKNRSLISGRMISIRDAALKEHHAELRQDSGSN